MNKKIVYKVEISEKEVRNSDFKKLRMFFDFIEEQPIEEQYNSLMIVFDGYDDIEKEIYEIKELRKYVSDAFIKFPHLSFFLSSDLESLPLFLSSISNYKKKGERNGMVSVEIKLPRETFKKLARGLYEFGRKNNALDKAEERLMMISDYISL